MTYYAAWYGPRFGDGTVCVSFVPGKAEECAKESAAFDAIEYSDNCEEGFRTDGPCSQYGCPYCDIVSTTEFGYPARYLFSAQELREHRRDLLDGKVVILYK